MSKAIDVELMKRIKNGEVPFVEFIDTPIIRYEPLDIKTNRVTSSILYKTSTEKNITIEELIENNHHCAKIFIYTPNDEFPYWVDAVEIDDPSSSTSWGSKVIGSMVRSLRYVKIQLTGSQREFEEDKFNKLMAQKKLDKNIQTYYESKLVDNTNYRRNKLLLLIH